MNYFNISNQLFLKTFYFFKINIVKHYFFFNFFLVYSLFVYVIAIESNENFLFFSVFWGLIMSLILFLIIDRYRTIAIFTYFLLWGMVYYIISGDNQIFSLNRWLPPIIGLIHMTFFIPEKYTVKKQ